MNTLYMHIGTTKTATTAIQSFCMQNQKLLNQKGYDYPLFPYRYKEVSERRNAHFLIAEQDKKGGVFREGMDKILDLFKTYPNMILSDEGIWSAPYQQRVDMWRALKAEGREHGFQIKVIVYLRRQDTYLISGWNQMVKSGIGDGAAMPWDKYVGERAYVHKMNYATHLKKLTEFFGKKNLIVRRFEPKRFIGGSIYDDFLHAVGLELTDEFDIGQSVPNARLEGNTQEIQRVLNGMPGMNASYHSFFRRALLSYAQISGADYPCDMFSQEEAEAFMEKYADENREVAESFFGEENLFDMKWKNTVKWEKDNPYMQDDLIRFVGSCCMLLMEENKKLRQEMNDLKNMIRHPLRSARKMRAEEIKNK